MRSVTSHLRRHLLATWRDREDNRHPVQVDTATRRVELRPDALGRGTILLRLTDTTTGDYVDAVLQRATLEEPGAATMLQVTLDELEAQLCEA